MPTIPELLAKLDEMYDTEEKLKKQIITLTIALQQCQDDIDLMQQVIMHQSNKKSRQ